MEAGSNRVQVFDLSGGFLTQFGGPGTGEGEFSVPTGITVDADLNIYVTDTGHHRVQKFNPCGAASGQGNLAASAGRMSYPLTLPSPTTDSTGLTVWGEGEKEARAVPNLSRARLTLFTLSGERAYTASERGRHGENSIAWALENLSGQRVASGLYVWVLRLDDGAIQRTFRGKVVVIQ